MSLIIDPGHGGKDPGGGTNKYWLEKNYVLEVSLYQYNRLKDMGIPVKITRTKDVYLSPNDRTNIVKRSGMK
ncbi:N-acetylmuramoyl-L-alanine amidase, partial [Planococcus sp. SIMBA_143]